MQKTLFKKRIQRKNLKQNITLQDIVTKRGRGRSPKQKDEVLLQEPKRGRGRPPKPKDEVLLQEPKRGRGRPPKPKDEVLLQEPKRGRGRPPKPKDENTIQEKYGMPIVAAKRGRPRKNPEMILTVPNKEFTRSEIKQLSLPQGISDKIIEAAERFGVTPSDVVESLYENSDMSHLDLRLLRKSRNWLGLAEERTAFIVQTVQNAFKEALTNNEFNKLMQKKLNIKHSSKNVKHFDVFITDLHFTGTDEDITNLENLLCSIKHEVGNTPIILNFLGDLVDGKLRVTDITKGNPGVVKQATQLGLRLVTMLKKSKIRIKHINHVFGNHGEIRLFGEAHAETVDNIELVIATILECAGYDVRTGFKIEEDEYVVVHGHLFKNVRALLMAHSDLNKVTYWGHYHSYDITESEHGYAVRVPAAQALNSPYENTLGHVKTRPRYLLRYGKLEGLVELNTT